jgi:hypothetical protein
MHPSRPTLRTSLLLLCALLAAQLLLSGCGIFSPQEPKDKKSTTPPDELATTPDILVKNFTKCYTGKNIDLYEKVLHPQFQFFFAQQDVSVLGVASWDREHEIRSTTNMFTGVTGTKPDGSQQPGIQSITLTLSPIGEWTTNVDAQYLGTQKHSYTVDMAVTYKGDSIDQVGGIQDLYVAPVIQNGQTIYQLKFWVDDGVTVH